MNLFVANQRATRITTFALVCLALILLVYGLAFPPKKNTYSATALIRVTTTSPFLVQHVSYRTQPTDQNMRRIQSILLRSPAVQLRALQEENVTRILSAFTDNPIQFLNQRIIVKEEGNEFILVSIYADESEIEELAIVLSCYLDAYFEVLDELEQPKLAELIEEVLVRQLDSLEERIDQLDLRREALASTLESESAESSDRIAQLDSIDQSIAALRQTHRELLGSSSYIKIETMKPLRVVLESEVAIYRISDSD